MHSLIPLNLNVYMEKRLEDSTAISSREVL